MNLGSDKRDIHKKMQKMQTKMHKSHFLLFFSRFRTSNTIETKIRRFLYGRHQNEPQPQKQLFHFAVQREEKAAGIV